MYSKDDESTRKTTGSQQVEVYTNKDYENLDDSEEEDDISTDPIKDQKENEKVISIDYYL